MEEKINTIVYTSFTLGEFFMYIFVLFIVIYFVTFFFVECSYNDEGSIFPRIIISIIIS